MKVAVLTFPLINNYGGIIQAYALMNLLKEEGHEPVLLNLQNEKFYKSYTKYIIKKYLLSFLGRFKNVTLLRKSAILKEFIDKEITPKTIAVYNASELKKLFKNDEFDACIVGSDQVFAKLGYPNFENMFSLGFVNDSVIKLSYAASFGKGSFSGEIDKINFHKQNLMRFKAVSVREDSAVSVCAELFDIKAQHLIDPTLAINKNYYIEMIEKSDYEPRNLGLFSYVLDVSLEKQEAIYKLAETKKLNIQSISDGNLNGKTISMYEWLGNIKNAEFVVTDSFHGCVFCIIFNTPFACILNEERGKDRFTSLLKQFGLESRLLNSQFIDTDIDWVSVNKKIHKLQDEAKRFLSFNLS